MFIHLSFIWYATGAYDGIVDSDCSLTVPPLLVTFGAIVGGGIGRGVRVQTALQIKQPSHKWRSMKNTFELRQSVLFYFKQTLLLCCYVLNYPTLNQSDCILVAG